MTKTYSHIIWDWNGTLLNDTLWGMKQMNRMLESRNKKILADVASYQAAFCFPIEEYYKNVGFDFKKESFESLAKEFIELYHGAGSEEIGLYQGAEKVLKRIQDAGISQIILSASLQANLDKQIESFAIRQYFDEVLGIDNIYAKSKIVIGLNYLSQNKIKHGIMIGDTRHDYEVAQRLGVDCVLVSHGHQSRRQLASCNVSIIDDLEDIIPLMNL